MTGNRHTQEFGDARGQPWPGLGLLVRTGAPHAPSGASFLVPGQLGSGAGYGLARGQAGTLCATCSPLTSCWVAEDVILAGPERALCGGSSLCCPLRLLGSAASDHQPQGEDSSARLLPVQADLGAHGTQVPVQSGGELCLFFRRGGFQGFSLGPPS